MTESECRDLRAELQTRIRALHHAERDARDALSTLAG
jgi:hypothetical protein